MKTLILLADGRPTAVLVAGDRQADTAALARLLGVSRKRLKMASPEKVLELTGFRVGGVPPVGLPGEWDLIADDSLARFSRVWAAAGASDALFGTGTDELVAATGAQWADDREDARVGAAVRRSRRGSLVLPHRRRA